MRHGRGSELKVNRTGLFLKVREEITVAGEKRLFDQSSLLEVVQGGGYCEQYPLCLVGLLVMCSPLESSGLL